MLNLSQILPCPGLLSNLIFSINGQELTFPLIRPKDHVSLHYIFPGKNILLKISYCRFSHL